MQKINYRRSKYEWVFSLQSSPQYMMLKEKENALCELYDSCASESQRELIKDLLLRFNCFDDETYNWALIGISKHIAKLVTESGYNPHQTAIVAMCHDSNADSSQAVLNDIRIPLYSEVCSSIPFKNRIDKLETYYNNGFRHFIVVDEFIGSGQTVIGRYNAFCRKDFPDATLDFCLIAGMEMAVKKCEEEGIRLYVEYTMKRGISDHYSGAILSTYLKDMELLEQNLATTINETKLKDHAFGYGRSESLYCRMNRNIPNNVFPIFWWKKDKNNKTRTTLFERLQDGY